MTQQNAILDRLAALDTNTVSDALDFLGLPGATYGIRPLWDCPKIVGRAATIQVGPKPDDRPTVHLITPVIEEITTDDRILVIAGGPEGISCWGDIIANAARAKRVRGSVIDGMSRDIEGSESIGYRRERSAADSATGRSWAASCKGRSQRTGISGKRSRVRTSFRFRIKGIASPKRHDIPICGNVLAGPPIRLQIRSPPGCIPAVRASGDQHLTL
ncbi:RraA family protein [Alicycliphilus denitrificans]|uniref:RraA family protein n=1 Tax=Alicycliphilus denitrificans TaxID=179636 RepID=UPI001FD28FE4|nr:hypothetical protein [Alicycliphilus denitrificans]